MNRERVRPHRTRSARTSRCYHRDQPSLSVPRNKVLVGDATARLSQLPSASIDCMVTSPPYHLLRRYSAGEREIGTEPDVTSYVDRIVAVMDEVARVMKSTGVAWLNLGDSFSRHPKYGAPPKGMLLAPERILLALAERGWIVRSKVIWHKPNHLPASVRDRLAMSYEPLYMLVRARHYYFALDAIRVPHRTTSTSRTSREGGYDATKPQWAGPLAGTNDGLIKAHAAGRVGNPLGKNMGDVWSIATGSNRSGHRATFPSRLAERSILATCPERTCLECGLPWARPYGHPDQPPGAQCECGAGWQPGIVLDPFIGSGTTGMVARQFGRDWLGIELNPAYAALAEARIAGVERRPP